MYFVRDRHLLNYHILVLFSSLKLVRFRKSGTQFYLMTIGLLLLARKGMYVCVEEDLL